MADILIDTEGAVRVLTINRPGKRNALAPGTADELREAIHQAESDPDIGAIVLTGTGGHFSAGGDADAILDVVTGGGDDAPRKLIGVYHQLLETVWQSELPIIAAVSGVAYGGAFNLALACDLVICSSDARFCQVFLRRGVVPDIGGAYLLPKIIGMQRAKELMLLNPVIDAAEAQRLGFVNAVSEDPLAKARELAGQLADSPRFAVSATKRLLNNSVDGDLHSALALESLTQSIMLRSSEAEAGFRAVRPSH